MYLDGFCHPDYTVSQKFQVIDRDYWDKLMQMLWFNFIFKFYFPWFWGMVMYDHNEFETKENKISTKDKIEPQHIHESYAQPTDCSL